MGNLKKLLERDDNGSPMGLMKLAFPHDIDGTSQSVQSNAINGYVVRIVSLDNILRVKIGTNPTAAATSEITVPALGEIYLPIEPGQKVAVRGGQANISTAGYWDSVEPTTTTVAPTTTAAPTTTV